MGGRDEFHVDRETEPCLITLRTLMSCFVTNESHPARSAHRSVRRSPPAARPLALMVVGSEVVRGQMPLEDFFASDAVIITGLAAAMIAIPIAVHNSGGKDKPASP